MNEGRHSGLLEMYYFCLPAFLGCLYVSLFCICFCRSWLRSCMWFRVVSMSSLLLSGYIPFIRLPIAIEQSSSPFARVHRHGAKVYTATQQHSSGAHDESSLNIPAQNAGNHSLYCIVRPHRKYRSLGHLVLVFFRTPVPRL